MKCPHCNKDTKVIDKRDTNTHKIRRRRECLNCKKRFTTYEKIQDTELFIIKKDGRREPFNKEKIKTGIVKACEKRPISIDKIDNIVDQIEAKLKDYGKKEINSKIIGELIIENLKQLDKVAYIRFASVYKDFKDLESFEKELENLRGK